MAPATNHREGPRTFRPRREPLRWADVRHLTLGELVDRARRHAHFVTAIALVLVVAVWFPGDAPISQRFVPSAGGSETAATERSDLDVVREAFEDARQRAADVAGSSVARQGVPLSPSPGPTGPQGALPGPIDPGGFDRDFGGQPDGAEGEGPTGDPRLVCSTDESLPEPVLGPTLEEAVAAQQALEERIGRPFPADVVSLAAVAAGCRYQAADGVGTVLLLGAVVPRDDPVLLGVLRPVVGPACAEVTRIAVFEALTTRSVSPGVFEAVRLCGAVAGASPPTPDAPAPMEPDVSGPSENPVDTPPRSVDEPSTGEPTEEPEIDPVWSGPAVFG